MLCFFASINLVNFLFWIRESQQSVYVLKKYNCVLNRLFLLTHSLQKLVSVDRWLLLWIHLGEIIKKLNLRRMQFQNKELMKTFWRYSKDQKCK